MSSRGEPPAGPLGVSPRVDCVFKALMGDPARSVILLDFLNAVLEPAVPITRVEIQNPVHLPDFVGDDFTIVDVLGTDAQGRIFQIEMQGWNETALKERALYTWADLYEGQLVAGQGYAQLKPVIAIWMLAENTLRNAPDFHHRFVVCDPDRRVVLSPHLEIHTLELAKWRAQPTQASGRVGAWMRFFSEAETWVDLPSSLRTPAMEEAMSVLHEFRTNAEWNAIYRARRDGLRRQLTQEQAMAAALADLERVNGEMERVLAEKDRVLAEKERVLAENDRVLAEREREREEKERALAELARLRAALANAGLDPER